MSENLCWLNVGPQGRFRKSGHLSSAPSDVDHLLGSAMASRTRLILHFHGGLVDELAGKAVAEKMAANYGDAAASIGLVWETGLLEVFRDRLRDIHDTRVFRKALSWVIARAAPALGVEEGARGAAGGSIDARAIEAQLESEASVIALDSALKAAADASGAEARARGDAGAEAVSEEAIASELELDLSSDPELVDLIERDAEGAAPIRRALAANSGARGLSLIGIAFFLAKVIVAVIRRYRHGTHHDPYPTAVEELLRAAYLGEVGQFAWDAMKLKAKDMWIDDGTAPGVEGHVGGYVLRRLAALQRERPEVTIDLVGHSAGSIAICHMLATIAAGKLPIRVRSIIFLAPAVRLHCFAVQIARAPDRFTRFRAFTMDDSTEKADRLVGIIYPRSLLFFISGLLEEEPGEPLAGLARHVTARSASAGPDYDDVRRWFAADDRLVLSPSPAGAAEGLRTSSKRHGDFDDNDATRKSLLFMAEERL